MAGTMPDFVHGLNPFVEGDYLVDKPKPPNKGYEMTHTDKSHSRLMYLFGSFKPSERATLLESARGNAKAFTEALELFLAKWAAATWIEEYNVERVGEWISAKCPPAVRNSARLLAERQIAKANGDETSIHFRTYRVFLDGLRCQPETAVVLPLHA